MELQDIIQIQQFVNKSNERNSRIEEAEYEDLKTSINEDSIYIYKEDEPIYQTDIEKIILFAMSKNMHWMIDNSNGKTWFKLF